MEFEYSKKTKMYMEQLTDFMTKYIYPNERVFHDQLTAGPTRWQIPPIMEELKATARERGLWNLFLPESERGAGLTNLEYAPLCEIMGRSEEHTSELQSPCNLVCRLLLEKKKRIVRLLAI